MNKSMLAGVGIGIAAALGIAAVASMNVFSGAPQYAQVIAATPIKETVKTPRQECRNVTVTHRKPVQDENQIAGSVLGAVAGGVLGHQVGGGRGKDIATVAGALAGGYAGNRVQSNMQEGDTYTTTQQRCQTVYDKSQKMLGYDVTYKIGDQQGKIRMDRDPGTQIPIDKNGQLIDGDHILYILATQAKNKPEGVVGTVMSNMALELALQKAKVGFVRAKVGDRYVLQCLEEKAWSIGGEPSGHILTLDKSTTGDAIIAALQVLTVMVEQDKALHELVDGLVLFPQVLVNVRLQHMLDPYAIPALVTEFEKAEQQLKGRGRILIRKSGTEPVIRVMVEGDQQQEVEALAQHLADAVRAQAQAA